jgi:hypothetical protein
MIWRLWMAGSGGGCPGDHVTSRDWQRKKGVQRSSDIPLDPRSLCKNGFGICLQSRHISRSPYIVLGPMVARVRARSMESDKRKLRTAISFLSFLFLPSYVGNLQQACLDFYFVTGFLRLVFPCTSHYFREISARALWITCLISNLPF